jgi:arylsulfatase A-like enzyme
MAGTEAAQMKVLVVISDSVGADVPGYTGGPAHTPRLDALARAGTVIEQAYTSAGWTIPSLTCMTTGVPAHRAGVCNWTHPLRPRQTLFSAFADAGWPVDVFVPSTRWGFFRWPGVDRIGDSQDTDAICASLASPGPRLVFVHHWWTHFPFITQRRPFVNLKYAEGVALDAFCRMPEVMRPKLRRLYHRSVEVFSEQVMARYLDALPDAALVVHTSDHGETFGEAMPPGRSPQHIFDLHGRWLCDTNTRVPMMFSGTAPVGRVPARRVCDGFWRGLDLAPTLCGLCDVPWQSTPGKDRSAVVMGAQEGLAEGVLTVSSHNTWQPDTYPWSGHEMWRLYSWRDARGRVGWDARTDRWEVPPCGHGEGVPDVKARLQAAFAEALGPLGRWYAPRARMPIQTDVAAFARSRGG